MGMRHNVTFHNAIIRPDRYANLIGWTSEEIDAAPEQAEALAFEAVREVIQTDACTPTRANGGGIDLNGCGYWDSAGYGYGESLRDLLRLCEPGAYIHEIDEEEGDGDVWRIVLQPDRTLRTVEPVITWPGFDSHDLPVFEKENAS